MLQRNNGYSSLLQQNQIEHTIPDQFPEAKPYSENQINMDSIRGHNEPGTDMSNTIYW